MTNPIPKIPSRGLLALGILLSLVVVLMLVADLSGRQIQELSLRYPGSDKLIHFVTHLGLTTLIYWILHRHWTPFARTHAISLAAAMSVLLGLLDESQQFFVGGREFDLLDVAANLCGTATGALLLAGFTQSPRRIALLAILPIGIFSGVYLHAYTENKLFSVGLQQIRAGDLPGAQQSFRRAIERGQGTPALYNELAWLELEFLDVDPAPSLRYSTLAVAAEPDNPDFLDTHAWALYRNGRYKEAQEMLQQALARKPDIYCIHYHLGAVYHALQEDDQAIVHLRQQLAVSNEGRFADEARALLAAIDARRRHRANRVIGATATHGATSHFVARRPSTGPRRL